MREQQIKFRAFRDFRGWIKNSRDVANEPRNTRKTRKGFSRDYFFFFSGVPPRYSVSLVQSLTSRKLQKIKRRIMLICEEIKL